jgi:hypothetical protein
LTKDRDNRQDILYLSLEINLSSVITFGLLIGFKLTPSTSLFTFIV